MVNNKLLVGLNRFSVRATSRYVLLWFIYTQKLFGPREGPLLINESKQRTYESKFISEMKQDEYSTANENKKLVPLKQPNSETLEQH